MVTFPEHSCDNYVTDMFVWSVECKIFTKNSSAIYSVKIHGNEQRVTYTCTRAAFTRNLLNLFILTKSRGTQLDVRVHVF